MTRKISGKRKTAFYIGMALCIIGALSFFSVFITGALNFGKPDNFERQVRSSALRAAGGMAFMVIGGIIMAVGARGAAGSGVLLDPERARDDLEPYSRMTGGMLKDVLEEADIKIGGGKAEQVIMIRCHSCGKLNEEDSKFCQECGEAL